MTTPFLLTMMSPDMYVEVDTNITKEKVWPTSNIIRNMEIYTDFITC